MHHTALYTRHCQAWLVIPLLRRILMSVAVLFLVDPDGHAAIEEMCELAPPPPWRRPKEGADDEEEEDDAAGAEADEAEVDAAAAV